MYKSLNIKAITYKGACREVDIETDIELYNSKLFLFPK